MWCGVSRENDKPPPTPTVEIVCWQVERNFIPQAAEVAAMPRKNCYGKACNEESTYECLPLVISITAVSVCCNAPSQLGQLHAAEKIRIQTSEQQHDVNTPSKSV